MNFFLISFNFENKDSYKMFRNLDINLESNLKNFLKTPNNYNQFSRNLEPIQNATQVDNYTGIK